MDQLSSQELADRIPKLVCQWTVEEVHKWLTINCLEIGIQSLQKHQIDGRALLKLTPNEWIDFCDLSKLVAKRIVEWVEEDSGQFNQLVSARMKQADCSSISRLEALEHSYPQILRNESVETRKSIQQGEQVMADQNSHGKTPIDLLFYDNVSKMEKRKKQAKQIIDSVGSKNQQFAKFVSSQLINSQHEKQSLSSSTSNRTYNRKLRLNCEDKDSHFDHMVTANCKIGRMQTNDIKVVEQSVSRFHAQIEAKMNEQTDQVQIFYLKDVGSKFGTFVPVGSRDEIFQGNQYQIGETHINVKHLTIHRQPGSHRIKNFDINLSFNSQDIKEFVSKTAVPFGRKNGELKSGNNYSCNLPLGKIILDKDKKSVIIEISQNHLYRKLKRKQVWNIEESIRPSKKCKVILGSLEIYLQIIKICTNCSQLAEECKC